MRVILYVKHFHHVRVVQAAEYCFLSVFAGSDVHQFDSLDRHLLTVVVDVGVSSIEAVAVPALFSHHSHVLMVHWLLTGVESCYYFLAFVRSLDGHLRRCTAHCYCWLN